MASIRKVAGAIKKVDPSTSTTRGRLRSATLRKGHYTKYDRDSKQFREYAQTSYTTVRNTAFGGTLTTKKFWSPHKNYVEQTLDNRGVTANILSFAVFICVLVILYRLLVGSSNTEFTFTNLLYTIRDVPSVNLDWIDSFNQWQSTSGIGILDWTINTTKDCLSLFIMLGAGVVQLMEYVYYFCKILLG